MIAAAHWRRGGPDGREPIAAAGDVVSMVTGYTPTQQHWGKLTSKRPPKVAHADLELIAYQLGCSVAAAKRALDYGLI